MAELEPTELAPSEDSTEMVTAWALDEYEPERRFTSEHITALAVAGSIAALVTVAVMAYQKLDWPITSTRVTVVERTIQAAPAPVVQTVIPSPTTVTRTVQAAPVQAAPVRAPATVWPRMPAPQTDYDQQFLNVMMSNGWNIDDRSLVLSTIHEFCQRIRQGESAEALSYEIAGRVPVQQRDVRTTAFMTDQAMRIYPGCAGWRS